MTMNSPAPYTAEAILELNKLSDVRIHINGKTWHMWGRKGAERERDMAIKIELDTLPVLIGSGLGHCLEELAKRGPVAVVDKEAAITTATGLKERHKNHPNILWLNDNSPQACFDELAQWQKDNGFSPFSPIIFPLYLRLDRNYYGALSDTLKQAPKPDFWSQARYPKFQSATPRILFFDSKYFLCNEIRSALEQLEIEFHSITLNRNASKGSQEFIETLLRAIIDFKPDFVLTVNHFGLDREGKLAGLLNDLELPLASWFVDNPHLILHHYAHPGTDNTVIFTYDAGNLEGMRQKGFNNVHYLPLATDTRRFKPGLKEGPPDWNCKVSFVGNSMTGPVAKSLHASGLTGVERDTYQEVAASFGQSGEVDVPAFFRGQAKDWANTYNMLPTPEHKLALESLITWEATRQYRLKCVKETLPFAPVIVGDGGWHDQLPQSDEWQYLTGLDYYEELPRFYPASQINFNCTSRQMPGAVNQRVFDVPACGAFLLTDYREQMESLFDLDNEVVVYQTPEEIPHLIERLLADAKFRKKISLAAYNRVCAEHTYEIRLQQLIKVMRTSP